METFDYGKAMADMWALGGKTFLEAQERALRAMREGAAAVAMPGMVPAAAAAAGAPPMLPALAFDAGEAAKAGQALTDLWASANSLAAALAEKLPKGGVDADSTAAATFRRMVDPRHWLSGGDDMDEALQGMAEGPRLADLWDVERKYAKVFGAWMALRRRSLEHQAVVLEGWRTAARRFTERFNELAAKGEAPATQRAALDVWVETANRALLEMQRSEQYLGSQGQILKASTELRLAQREVVEYYARNFGFPTRTELDDVHRTVTEMRRELRATRRELRTASAARAAAPGPAPAPRRAASAARGDKAKS